MNWGIIIAWITNTGSFDAKMVGVLFFGSCWYARSLVIVARRSSGYYSWTLHYDSTYAMQDKDDDVKAGVKSTAVLFGKYARPILSTFCVGFVAALAYFGILNEHGPAYFGLTVLGTAVHLLWQVTTLDINNPKSCFARFDANGRHVGFIVASGMAVDYTLRVLV
jgi:4-hydroxybenzoate polyprenyltransferase